jgi:hypothetical protein
MFKDDVLYFVGFDLLKNHVAVPKSSGNGLSLRCCKKEAVGIGEFIEITDQMSRSPSLLRYFTEKNALLKYFMLVGYNSNPTYFMTKDCVDLSENDVCRIIAEFNIGK